MQPVPGQKRPRQKITGLNDPRIVPYVTISPFVIYLLCVYLYPTIASVIMSFQRIDGPNSATFIGLSNYSKLLSKNYIMALKTTAWFTVWDVAILIPVPLLFAAMLASRQAPLPNFFKSLYFIPALTSIIVAGIVFRLAFGSLDTSLANTFIGLFGMEPKMWLQFAVNMIQLLLMGFFKKEDA